MIFQTEQREEFFQLFLEQLQQKLFLHKIQYGLMSLQKF